MIEISPETEVWNTIQNILVILAHPDDPEYFCGASIAYWSSRGHHIKYCLLTCGEKGTKDRSLTSEQLCSIRVVEQQNAARLLGVNEVRFLGYPDGYLVPDLELRKAVTRVIRQEKPDILVTCDPQTLFYREDYINHPDHRAAGQVVLDAVFPSARDYLFFPELLEENLEPHHVREVWVSLPSSPNVTLEVTDWWDLKIQAIKKHKSQILDEQALTERMLKRIAPGSSLDNPRYVEYFRRVIMR